MNDDGSEGETATAAFHVMNEMSAQLSNEHDDEADANPQGADAKETDGGQGDARQLKLLKSQLRMRERMISVLRAEAHVKVKVNVKVKAKRKRSDLR